MLSARDGIPSWTQIEELIKQWQPQILVVGLPLNMDDSDNEITVRARKFSRRLNGRFNLPTYLWDERLSSISARERLDQGQANKRDSIDSIAAQIILESWLSTHPQLSD